MLKKPAAALGSAIFSLALLGWLLGMLADQLWLGELAVNLRWQIGVGALASLPLLGFGGSRFRSAGAAVVVVLVAVPVARLAWAPHSPIVAGTEFRIATINVLADNRETERLDAWLLSEQPDVVALIEVSTFWADHVGGASPLAAYPFGIVDGRVGTFGIALFSRWPIMTHAVHEVGSPGLPYIVATLNVEGCAVEVAAVHTFPPVTSSMRAGRDAQLRDVGEHLSAGAPSVVVGDLNATLFSPAFHRFLEDNALTDSRRGIGREASWMPILGPLGLDLDHILVQPGLQVRSRRLGGPIGGDHVPVVADIVVHADHCVPPSTTPAPSGLSPTPRAIPRAAMQPEGSGSPVAEEVENGAEKSP